MGCREPNKLGVYSDMSVLMDWVKDMVAAEASFIWRSENEITSPEKTICCDVMKVDGLDSIHELSLGEPLLLFMFFDILSLLCLCVDF